ncbi:DUF2064 domain-containing protein [Aquimarina sp. RZ0]|uniref:TIGR04282 family arsenosugar biosynthesis glycosyltransferase n=1 Tax=Aquimarina sp. RZ0 TaxID=2607730 RepID=UPI0011F21E95|nr:DUF2064 domain-containing protein [Aquimarina sp. RZ0]KAA1244103.1 DUF2064 domain-containing protein [Aquimarina sp. RZ0]
MNSKTAILVFANSAKEELQRKPIHGGEKLFDELTKKTLSIVKSTGLPFYIFTEKDQKGITFGERFVHAIQSVYDLGFENVIAIGNDTPYLKKQHILKSTQQLENNKFVLGPSADGGFYLMGLHRSQFNAETFLKLPWQSKDLAKSVTRFIKAAKIEVTHLQVLFDIDTIDDLKMISKFCSKLSKKLNKIILDILQSTAKIWRFFNIRIDDLILLFYFNKGSPISIY